VACMVAVSGCYATVMGGGALLPLWLQVDMGYSAVEAGRISGMNGITGFFFAGIAAKLCEKYDPRKVAMTGMIIAAFSFAVRTGYTTEVDYWGVAWPTLLVGVAVPLVFMPMMSLALSSMPTAQLASATGLLGFTRTLSGAFGVAIIITLWDMRTTINHDALVGGLSALNPMAEAGLPALGQLSHAVQSQSVMIATNQVHGWLATVLVIAAICLLMVRRNASPALKPD
jgi:MFS transporter, DHA2 family, multidrug resistance protein